MGTRHLFITKNANELSVLPAFCAKNQLTLQAQTLITFEAVKAIVSGKSEVYFFGSRNAFDFYLLNASHNPSKIIACIGEATKKHIEKLGYSVSFCGTNAGDPKSVSKELIHFLGKRNIAFFHSDLSKKTIAKEIPALQKEEIVVYRTILNALEFQEKADVCVFTSPSNVDAFLMKNSISPETILIAWGKVTAKTLTDRKFKVHHILKNASEKELIDTLSKI